MIKLTLENKTIEIPNLSNEISLELFEKMVKSYSAEYEYNIDRIIAIISAVSELSVDEIGELPFETINEIFESLNFNKEKELSSEIIKEVIIINDIKYGILLNDGKLKLKLKEVKELEKILTYKSDGYISYYAAILFRELDENGIQIGGLDKESIENRVQIFNKHMTIDIVEPLAAQLNQQFIKKYV